MEKKILIVAAVAAVALVIYSLFNRSNAPINSSVATSPFGSGGLLGTPNANNPFSALSAGLAGLETALNIGPSAPNPNTLSGTNSGALNAATATPAQLAAAGLQPNVAPGSASNLTISESDLVQPTGTPTSLGAIENEQAAFNINNPVVPTSSPISTSLSTADLSDEQVMSLVGGNSALGSNPLSFQAGTFDENPFAGINSADLSDLEA